MDQVDVNRTYISCNGSQVDVNRFSAASLSRPTFITSISFHHDSSSLFFTKSVVEMAEGQPSKEPCFALADKEAIAGVCAASVPVATKILRVFGCVSLTLSV